MGLAWKTIRMSPGPKPSCEKAIHLARDAQGTLGATRVTRDRREHSRGARPRENSRREAQKAVLLSLPLPCNCRRLIVITPSTTRTPTLQPSTTATTTIHSTHSLAKPWRTTPMSTPSKRMRRRRRPVGTWALILRLAFGTSSLERTSSTRYVYV